MEKDRLTMLIKKNAILLTESLVKIRNDFQVSKVAELDKKVELLLSKIASKPEVSTALISELDALYLVHKQLLDDCQRETVAIKKTLNYVLQNKDGLLAYQEMDEQ